MLFDFTQGRLRTNDRAYSRQVVIEATATMIDRFVDRVISASLVGTCNGVVGIPIEASSVPQRERVPTGVTTTELYLHRWVFDHERMEAMQCTQFVLTFASWDAATLELERVCAEFVFHYEAGRGWHVDIRTFYLLTGVGMSARTSTFPAQYALPEFGQETEVEALNEVALRDVQELREERLALQYHEEAVSSQALQAAQRQRSEDEHARNVERATVTGPARNGGIYLGRPSIYDREEPKGLPRFERPDPVDEGED